MMNGTCQRETKQLEKPRRNIDSGATDVKLAVIDKGQAMALVNAKLVLMSNADILMKY